MVPSLSLRTSTILLSIVSFTTALLWCLVHYVVTSLLLCRRFFDLKYIIYFSMMNLRYLPVSSTSVVDFVVVYLR